MIIIGSKPEGENYCHALENVAVKHGKSIGDKHWLLLFVSEW